MLTPSVNYLADSACIVLDKFRERGCEAVWPQGLVWSGRACRMLRRLTAVVQS